MSHIIHMNDHKLCVDFFFHTNIYFQFHILKIFNLNVIEAEFYLEGTIESHRLQLAWNE